MFWSRMAVSLLLVSALVTLRWMWAQRGGRTALAAGLR